MAYCPSHLPEQGIALIYGFEAEPQVSNHLYWPGGESGVTLGPGFDLRNRTQDEATTALERVGVDTIAARTVARGCGLSGQDAKQFAAANKDAVDLSGTQQQLLLLDLLGPYEDAVRRDVRVDLNDNEFSALVSLAYNIGPGNFAQSTVLEKLNSEDRQEAADAFLMWDKSGGDVSQALLERREKERELFLRQDILKS